MEGSGSSLVWTSGANAYLCSFNSYAPGELFDNYFSDNPVLQSAYALAYNAWVAYLGQTLTTPTCPTCTPPAPGSYDVTIQPPPSNTYTCRTGCP